MAFPASTLVIGSADSKGGRYGIPLIIGETIGIKNKYVFYNTSIKFIMVARLIVMAQVLKPQQFLDRSYAHTAHGRHTSNNADIVYRYSGGGGCDSVQSRIVNTKVRSVNVNYCHHPAAKCYSICDAPPG